MGNEEDEFTDTPFGSQVSVDRRWIHLVWKYCWDPCTWKPSVEQMLTNPNACNCATTLVGFHLAAALRDMKSHCPRLMQLGCMVVWGSGGWSWCGGHLRHSQSYCSGSLDGPTSQFQPSGLNHQPVLVDCIAGGYCLGGLGRCIQYLNRPTWTLMQIVSDELVILLPDMSRSSGRFNLAIGRRCCR